LKRRNQIEQKEKEMKNKNGYSYTFNSAYSIAEMKEIKSKQKEK